MRRAIINQPVHRCLGYSMNIGALFLPLLPIPVEHGVAWVHTATCVRS